MRLDDVAIDEQRLGVNFWACGRKRRPRPLREAHPFCKGYMKFCGVALQNSMYLVEARALRVERTCWLVWDSGHA
jgi:hypothetical protein